MLGCMSDMNRIEEFPIKQEVGDENRHSYLPRMQKGIIR